MRRIIMWVITALVICLGLNIAAQAQYTVDFEDGTKASYTNGNVTLNGKTWTLADAVIGTLANDKKNGTKAGRMRWGSAELVTIMLAEDLADGCGSVTLQYARYGTDGGVTSVVEYSTDSGANWTAAGASFSSLGVDALTEHSATVDQNVPVRVRVRAIGGAASARKNIDDIVITPYGGAAVVTNVKFTASAASVDEDAGTYEITVIKTLAEGNVSGQIELGGTATEGGGADYTIDATNFTMNGATTSATFTVTINDDADQEGSETITLTLANIVGGNPVSPTVFTLTINANDFGASQIIISQYTETDSGTTPKGIEIWNVSGGDITFDGTDNLLDLKIGVNGGVPASALTVNSGTLANGAVWVIGTADMSPTVEKSFTFNGDDAMVLELGGVVQDVFGQPGVDPGDYWAGNGVSTINQNIQLKDGITDGDKDGWSDPSERFETVAAGSDLTGFGVAPGGSPQTNVKFTASAASVSEDVGTYDVIIIKTLAEGTVTGTIELGGAALEGGAADYTVSSTNFTLDGATTSATITITVNDDALQEDAETVVLTLANVAGGTVVSPSEFTLTIAANDAPPQGILSFRFTADPFLQVSTKDPNLTVSDMALSAGAIATDETSSYFPNNPSIKASGGWAAPDQTTAKNFFFTLEPAVGYAVAVTGISFRAYRSPAGPGSLGFDIRSGTSTYAAEFPSGELVELNQAVTGITGEESSMTVLIQGWTNALSSSTGGGDFRLDDVVIWGTVTSTGSGPTQPDITGFEVPAGATASVTLTSVNGQTYNLEYTVDPTAAPVVWTAADTVVGDGDEITLSDADPADVMRIYRVTTE